MKRIYPESIAHETLNKIVINLLESSNVKYVVKLDDALAKRKVTQSWLATTTGLREAAISDLVKGNKTSLNKLHIIAIMNVLRITDITELIDIEFEPSAVEQYKEESDRWINEGIIPLEIQKLHEDNLKSQLSK